MDLKDLCAKLGINHDEALTKLGEEANELFIGKGEFIPKGRFDEVNTQNKDLKSQITERDGQIKTLSEGAKGNEELTKKLKEFEDKNKALIADYEGKITARERNYLIENSLRDAKVKNAKAAKALLDDSKITVADGKLLGFNEQLEAIKKSDSYLFDLVPDPNPTPPPGFGKPPGNPTPGGYKGSLDLSNPESVSLLSSNRPWKK